MSKPQTTQSWKTVAQLFHKNEREGTIKYKIISILDNGEGRGFFKLYDSETKNGITVGLSAQEWFYLSALADKRGQVQLVAEEREIARKDAERASKQKAATATPPAGYDDLELG